MTLSGHCHEVPGPDSWSATVESSVCVNVGQGIHELRYTIIDFDFDTSLGPTLPNRITVEAYPWQQIITIEGGSADTAEGLLHLVRSDPGSVREGGMQGLSPQAFRSRVQNLVAREGGALSQSELELHRNISNEEVTRLIDTPEILWLNDESGYLFPVFSSIGTGLFSPRCKRFCQACNSPIAGARLCIFYSLIVRSMAPDRWISPGSENR
jgi:hypothetical protein